MLSLSYYSHPPLTAAMGLERGNQPSTPQSEPKDFLSVKMTKQNLKTGPCLIGNSKVWSSSVQAKHATSSTSSQMLTADMTNPLHGMPQNNLQQQLTQQQQPVTQGQAVSPEQEAAAYMQQNQLQAYHHRTFSGYDISNILNSQPLFPVKSNSLSPANSSLPTTTHQQTVELAQTHGLVSGNGLVSGKPPTSKVILVPAKPKKGKKTVQFHPQFFKTQVDGDPGDSSDD